MSSLVVFRSFVSDRLTVAVEEIMGMFEKTMAEYKEELLGARQPNNNCDAAQHIRPMLTTVKVSPVHRETSPVPPYIKEDAAQHIRPMLTTVKVSPVHREMSPVPPYIKEEPEEIWTSPTVNPEEFGTSNVLFPSAPVNDEGAKEKPLSSSIQQRESVEHRETASSVSSPGEPFEGELYGEDPRGSGAIFHSDTAGILKAANNSPPAVFHHLMTEVLNNGRNFFIKPKPPSDSQKYVDPVPPSARHPSKCYECPECGKIFKYNNILQRHMSCHTGAKPFGCIECGRKFTQKSSLDRHKRMHTGEKPFSCLFCGKTFTRGGTLTSHMRFHTGENPFTCSICKKSCNNRAALLKHIRTHESYI
ncbi:zinc finger protein 629-like isoform X1 [Entelurus aequoreus]|uniref:zinc finger protein 629-like isoform X1 n=1 Tax=Entelurus aequoreus TaxID=161455 RepID=UPI002B1D3377|nr:zinc finger protein 629-like isoform X1 [Entelurus aequoreus]